MDVCVECGSTNIASRLDTDGLVYECRLCGALGGNAAAVQRLLDADQARAQGVSPVVWPLVQGLQSLPGIRVHGSDGGDPRRGAMPFVQWQVLDGRGLMQLENVAKSLQLAAAVLQCAWAIEVGFESTLLFTLRPRDATGSVASAQADAGLLQRSLDRDSRLSWWRGGRAPG